MIAEFSARYGATPAQLSDADLDAARTLVTDKFGTEEWTHLVP